jgi:FkbM family methyltransferase
MEGIRPAIPFLRLLFERAATLTLIDIGCSGGIDDVWRTFGSRLRAFGFDPNLKEIERLNAAETLPGVEYIAALIGPPKDDPAMTRMRARAFWDRNPWSRLSVARTLEVRAAVLANSGSAQQTRLNQPTKVPLEESEAPLVLAEFLREREISDVDFVKIDVDGADFLILRSLELMLKATQVLGLGIEVNFFGSDDKNVNTFHNVDRFMKGAGFELFDLSVRRYSVRALPAPYAYVNPAQGAWGRILQGDALYIRDAAAPQQATWAGSVGAHKLAKLAAIFAIFGLPDCAAEILLCFRSELAAVVEVDTALDALVKHCVPEERAAPGHAIYIKEFDQDAPRFYPARKSSLWR